MNKPKITALAVGVGVGVLILWILFKKKTSTPKITGTTSAAKEKNDTQKAKISTASITYGKSGGAASG